jgi:hypothetical protein
MNIPIPSERIEQDFFKAVEEARRCFQRSMNQKPTRIAVPLKYKDSIANQIKNLPEFKASFDSGSNTIQGMLMDWSDGDDLVMS